MPSRVIREGWIESHRIDSLDAHGERFFLRLCLKADDFGRYHAVPQLLKSLLFPLKEDVRNTDTSRWLAACEKAGLVRCYEVTGKRFLEINNFEQRLRAKISKFPQMLDACQTDDRHTPVIGRPESEAESEAESETKRNGKEEKGAGPNGGSVVSGFEIFWNAYPRKIGKRGAEARWKQLKPDVNQCLRAIVDAKKTEQWRKDGGQFIPYPATWLHQGRWDDVPKIELGRRAAAPAPQADPFGWAEWRDKSYPNADKLPFAKVTKEIQEEFEKRPMNK